jgi:hypothetical protein
LSNLIYKKVNKLLLFAPGLGFIDKDTKFTLKLDEDKILIGWNNEDTKVKYDNIYPKLKLKLPNTQVKLFNKDTHNDVDTQHEINSKFIEFIY